VIAPFSYQLEGAHENRLRLGRASEVLSDALVREGLAREEAEARAARLQDVDVDPAHLARGLAGQTRGVAIFIGPETVRAFALAEQPAEEIRVGDCFALRTLIRAVQGATRFRVLALSANAVGFFEGDEHGLQPAAVPGLPESLEEALGSELGGHRLDLTTGGPTTIRGARFFSRRDPRSEHAIDLERFHRGIARALEKEASVGQLPLVLATDESNAGRFRKVARLPALLAETAVGNAEYLEDAELFAKVWPLVAAELERRRAELAADYERARNVGKGLTALERVAEAAIAGRVRRLWVAEKAAIPGRMDLRSGRLLPAGEGAADVLDALATAVLRHGGEVIVAATPPAPGAVAAELR
jgi:hypothetical protein